MGLGGKLNSPFPKNTFKTLFKPQMKAHFITLSLSIPLLLEFPTNKRSQSVEPRDQDSFSPVSHHVSFSIRLNFFKTYAFSFSIGFILFH